MASDRMDRRRVLRGMTALGGTGLAASLAGCSSEEAGPEGTEEPPPTATETRTTEPPTTETTEPPTTRTTEPTTDATRSVVGAATVDAYGDVLADPEGNVLYMFEPDERGPSTCYDDCAGAWPPLTVESEAELSAGTAVTTTLGTVERDDGSLQVTADGWPLYYFAGDESPGDANGQGIGNVWWVLRPDGAVLRSTVSAAEHDVLGNVLTDAGGNVLYMFAPDERGPSTCYDECAGAWPPLTVESRDDLVTAATVSAGLGTVEREDGSLQVTADDWPLYYFANDEEPGQASGQEIGNVWFVLRTDGSPLKPTVSSRDVEGVGEILTDPDGMTLYMFENDDAGGSTCYGGCAEAWPPLTVESADALVESVRADVTLGTTGRDDGGTQVTAGQWPLYYYANDESPGDVTGQGVNDAWYVLRADGTAVTPTPTGGGDGDGGSY